MSHLPQPKDSADYTDPSYRQGWNDAMRLVQGEAPTSEPRIQTCGTAPCNNPDHEQKPSKGDFTAELRLILDKYGNSDVQFYSGTDPDKYEFFSDDQAIAAIKKLIKKIIGEDEAEFETETNDEYFERKARTKLRQEQRKRLSGS
jgi:hypothetical protein